MSQRIEPGPPWLEPFAPWLPLPLQNLADSLGAHQPAYRFVPQAALPEGEAYESFVARSCSVPTREASLHDAFNGLIWLAQPALKARLNALQAAAIARDGIQPRRGPLRDALTLFDENGALWPDCPAPILAAWRERDWRTMFITHRLLWAQSRPRLVGHALLEQLQLAPRKGLCAHVLPLDPLQLNEADWARKPFLPLPVLGVPGWWPANVDAGFYDEPSVFRPLPPR